MEVKNIPIIYSSANSQIEKLTEEAGADAFLSKPFDIEDLEKVFDSVISFKN